jgi:hypothetical protein
LNWKSFFDNPQEFFIGACLQFPLIFCVGWWILPIMGLCAVLWRLGGWEYGNKLYRRLGVTILVTGATFVAAPQHWLIFLAVPFMVWLAPSYGKDGILWKWFKNDLPVRLICFSWYWAAFVLAYIPQM